MNDRDTMENLLLTAKGVCDLYLHGSLESDTPKVQQAFRGALNDALCMQSDIYKQMSEHGWYPRQQAQPQQIQQVKQKFSVNG